MAFDIQLSGLINIRRVEHIKHTCLIARMSTSRMATSWDTPPVLTLVAVWFTHGFPPPPLSGGTFIALPSNLVAPTPSGLASAGLGPARD